MSRASLAFMSQAGFRARVPDNAKFHARQVDKLGIGQRTAQLGHYHGDGNHLVACVSRHHERLQFNVRANGVLARSWSDRLAVIFDCQL